MSKRIAALASLIALAVTSLAAGPSLAASNSSPSGKAACEAGGHQWTDGKGCANKTCKSGGTTYQPGDSRRGPPILGMKRNMYFCDGFTGNWQRL